jgi:iron complex outermembrane receptor protein
MNRRKLALASTVLSSLTLWAAASAEAQTTSGTPSDQRQAPAGVAAIGEVVVTAEKRTEKLERVPIPISAYSSKQRDLIGIQTIQDIAEFTPGLTYGGPDAAIAIRGIGRVTNALGTDPGVATYYDGVYQSDTSFASLPTFLAAQEEILRGPQGTLYGRNSIGGAINVTTFKPTDTFQAEFDQTIGNYETSYTGLRVSGPIAQNLDFLLAGVFNYQGQGYIHNIAGPDTGTTRTPSLEAQLEYRPTDKLKFWVTYDVSFVNSVPAIGAGNSASPYNNAATPANETFNGLVLNPLYGYTVPNPGVKDIFKNNIGYVGYEREPIPTQIATFHVDWDLGPATLKYIGGYTRFSSVISEDIDYTGRTTPFTIPYTGVCVPGYCPYPSGISVSPTNTVNIADSDEDWSNELDLTSNGKGPARWIVGLYQFGEAETGNFALANPGQLELQNPVGGPPNPTGAYYTADANLQSHSYAVFGQFDYDLTHDLTLTGGLRYTLDDKTGTESIDFNYFNPNATSTNQSYQLQSAQRADKGQWSGLTGKAAIEYRPDRSTNVYFSFSRGYKSGGFALGDFDLVPDVKPEYVNTFDVGLKEVVGHTLQMNLDAFYYDYDDFQARAYIYLNGIAMGNLLNVPKSRAYGVEEEAVWSPVDDLQLTLSYSYLNAKIDEFSGAIDSTNLNVPGPQNLAGQDLPLSPRNKIAFNALYTFNFTPGSLSLSGTVAWTDRSYAALFDTRLNLIPASSNVEARATWEDAEKRYSVIVFVNNLLDTVSINSVGGSQNFLPLSGFTQARDLVLNPPRTFGIEVKRFF